MTELSNLLLFFTAIAKFLLITGVGLGGAVVVIAECCGFRVVALGVEKVRSGQLARTDRDGLIPTLSNRDGNKPAPEVMVRAA